MKGIKTLLCAMFLAPFLLVGVAHAASVTEVTDANFQQEVIDHQGVVIVEAYATWCGPCKVYGPRFESVAASHTGNVKFVKFDVDKNRTISTKLGVRGVPATYCFAKNSAGEVIATGAGGALSESSLESLVSLCTGPDAESKLQRFDY